MMSGLVLNRLCRLGSGLPLVFLGGCETVVLHPAGMVALQQRDILVESVLLMLLVIVPVLVLTVFFAWHYRKANTTARYEPDWDHSLALELLIWGAPLLIIICLGAITWKSTHLLDPYREVSARKGASADAATPLEVDVVALDWKWLFIYPQYGVASVNQMAAPVDRPVDFHITASSVMNSFYIPALAGQIYAMPAMETRLHAVTKHTGDYRGISANYSGAGFSGMHFVFSSLSQADFTTWIAKAKQGDPLDRGTYLKMAQPSEDVSPALYASPAPQLYHDILNMCVEPGKLCVDRMMAIDAQGRGAAPLPVHSPGAS